MPSQPENTLDRGFTLIELMIVIAIVGILASVAMPSYRDYVRKAEMSKVITAMEGVKTRAIMYYNTNGTWPADNPDVDMDTLTSYANENMDNLYVRTYNGNGMVYSHINETVFGATSTSWVRMRIVDDNGMLKIDCTETDGQWPTSAELHSYINC